MKYLLFALLAINVSLLGAQRSPSFGLQFSYGANYSEIETSRETVRGEFGSSLSGELTLSFRPARQLTLRTGLELGFLITKQSVANAVTFNQEPQRLYLVTGQFHLGLPLSVLYAPVPSVPIYLKGGLRYRLNGGPNVTASTDIRGITDEARYFPEREASFRRNVWSWEAGLGFRLYNHDRMQFAYGELTLSRSIGNYVDEVVSRTIVPNYVASAGLWSLTFTAGKDF